MTEKTVSFSASELKAVLDAAIAEALAARDAKPVPANKLVDGKTEIGRDLGLKRVIVLLYEQPRFRCGVLGGVKTTGRIRPGELFG